MASDPRLAAILAAAPELTALGRWLDEQRRSTPERRDYLFLEGRPRFEPRREDVALVTPGVSVSRKGKDAVVIASVPAAPPVEIPVPSVPPAAAEKVIAAIDGTRTLLEARWAADVSSDVFARVLRATFGLVVVAPAAVQALEARLSSIEIVRYPTSPYAIERTYWENAADVRERATALGPELVSDDARFVEALRELHVVQILGAELDRFYRPASPATDGGIDPGAFHRGAPRLLDRGAGPSVFLDGLRVLAPAVGGTRAFAALSRSVDDVEAVGPRPIVDAGLSFGRVVSARGEGDETAKLWFIPPRPITEGHWAALAGALREAHAATDRSVAIAAAARFHARFVRLHPFRCANQSIAMNLANAVVTRVVGCGIPHLALDHLALRLRPDAYERVFARAVHAYAEPADSAGARLVAVRSRSRAALAFCDGLEKQADDAQVEEAIAARPDAAAWALLR